MRTSHLAHYPNVFEEEIKKHDAQSQPVGCQATATGVIPNNCAQSVTSNPFNVKICFDLDVEIVGHELWLETWNTGQVVNYDSQYMYKAYKFNN